MIRFSPVTTPAKARVDAFLTGRTVRAGGKIINGSGIKTIGGVPPYRETIGYVARGLVVYHLLRARQMFPGTFVSSVYPPAVSESVARVWLRDPEIGFNGSLLTQISNPIFLNAELASQTDFPPFQSDEQNINTKIPKDTSVRPKRVRFPKNIFVPSAETVSKNSISDDKEERALTASNEIFYEPRTGARFKMLSGKKERLTDNGELVVSEQLRPFTSLTSRARGTFFGGSTNRVLINKNERLRLFFTSKILFFCNRF